MFLPHCLKQAANDGYSVNALFLNLLLCKINDLGLFIVSMKMNVCHGKMKPYFILLYSRARTYNWTGGVC